MRPTLWILPAAVLAIAGCKGNERAAETARPAGQQGMSGMMTDSVPMGGEHRGMGGAGMMPMMQGHMDSMMRMSPGQMSAMMASHDRRMSQMMDQMGSDMRNMRMSGDAKWNGLVDSVKADLAELPGLEGAKLTARMKAHDERVRRLIAMHEGMMKGT